MKRKYAVVFIAGALCGKYLGEQGMEPTNKAVYRITFALGWGWADIKNGRLPEIAKGFNRSAEVWEEKGYGNR